MTRKASAKERWGPRILPVVSIVVPFWGYLIGSLLYGWLNQKRNYNGDCRYCCGVYRVYIEGSTLTVKDTRKCFRCGSSAYSEMPKPRQEPFTFSSVLKPK